MPKGTELADQAAAAEALGAEFINGSGFEEEETDSLMEQKEESDADDH